MLICVFSKCLAYGGHSVKRLLPTSLGLCPVPLIKPCNAGGVGFQRTFWRRRERNVRQSLAVALGGLTEVAGRCSSRLHRVLVSWCPLGWGTLWFWVPVNEHYRYVRHGVGDRWGAATGLLLSHWGRLDCLGLAHAHYGVARSLGITRSHTLGASVQAVEAGRRAGWTSHGSRRWRIAGEA